MRYPVIYEHPLNERIRTFLRLEFLFRQAAHCNNLDTLWDSRLYVTTLLDILAILSRADLKTELIKELERNATNLSRLGDSPDVDQQQLVTILKHLDHLRSALHASTGTLGQELRDNEFLASVRQRASIPGGTCDFDLPAFHRWLHRPLNERKQDQQHWFDSLKLTRQGIELILKLIRNSAPPQQEIAAAGGFQRALDPDVPYQLVRIGVDAELPYFLEVSGGRHRFTVRFLEHTAGRPQQAAIDIPFRLTCCAL